MILRIDIDESVVKIILGDGDPVLPGGRAAGNQVLVDRVGQRERRCHTCRPASAHLGPFAHPQPHVRIAQPCIAACQPLGQAARLVGMHGKGIQVGRQLWVSEQLAHINAGGEPQARLDDRYLDIKGILVDGTHQCARHRRTLGRRIVTSLLLVAPAPSPLRLVDRTDPADRDALDLAQVTHDVHQVLRERIDLGRVQIGARALRICPPPKMGGSHIAHPDLRIDPVSRFLCRRAAHGSRAGHPRRWAVDKGDEPLDTRVSSGPQHPDGIAVPRPVVRALARLKGLGPPPRIADLVPIAAANVVAIDREPDALVAVKQEPGDLPALVVLPTPDVLCPPGARCAKPFHGLVLSGRIDLDHAHYADSLHVY